MVVEEHRSLNCKALDDKETDCLGKIVERKSGISSSDWLKNHTSGELAALSRDHPSSGSFRCPIAMRFSDFSESPTLYYSTTRPRQLHDTAFIFTAF